MKKATSSKRELAQTVFKESDLEEGLVVRNFRTTKTDQNPPLARKNKTLQ